MDWVTWNKSHLLKTFGMGTVCSRSCKWRGRLDVSSLIHWRGTTYVIRLRTGRWAGTLFYPLMWVVVRSVFRSHCVIRVEFVPGKVFVSMISLYQSVNVRPSTHHKHPTRGLFETGVPQNHVARAGTKELHPKHWTTKVINLVKD